MNALGLTGAHVMDGEPATHELLRDLEGTGELTLRLRVPLWITPDMSDEADRGPAARCATRAARLWRGGVAKFFADGVIDAGTAWLEAPDTPRRGHRAVLARPGADGRARWRGSPRAGFQLATHTIGDAAVRFTLGRLPPRGRGAGHPAPARAPGDDPGRPRALRSPRRASSRRCSRSTSPRCAATGAATGTSGSGPSAPRARSGCATWWTRARCSRSAATGRSPTPTRGSGSPPRGCGGCRRRRRSSPCSPTRR